MAKKQDGFVELVKTIFYALLIAGVFRTFFFQPFWIPSGSMKSTLLIGDFLFVSKYSYGFSRHSFPWSLAPFEGRVMASMPDRGDVIVFKHPRNGQDYVKRLIGLPGDQIAMKDGVLIINGTPVKVEDGGKFVEPRVPGTSLNCKPDRSIDERRFCSKDLLWETLPDGPRHAVLNADANRSVNDNFEAYTVPDGHFFFMGDNRDNSLDSRANVGFVPFENLVGRAEIIALSFGGAFYEFWNWRGDRFFQWIK